MKVKVLSKIKTIEQSELKSRNFSVKNHFSDTLNFQNYLQAQTVNNSSLTSELKYLKSVSNNPAGFQKIFKSQNRSQNSIKPDSELQQLPKLVLNQNLSSNSNSRIPQIRKNQFHFTQFQSRLKKKNNPSIDFEQSRYDTTKIDDKMDNFRKLNSKSEQAQPKNEFKAKISKIKSNMQLNLGLNEPEEVPDSDNMGLQPISQRQRLLSQNHIKNYIGMSVRQETHLPEHNFSSLKGDFDEIAYATQYQIPKKTNLNVTNNKKEKLCKKCEENENYLRPILYKNVNNKINVKTAKEFNLTKEDTKFVGQYKTHRFNHIAMNTQIAINARKFQEYQQTFRSSIYNKSSRINLQKIKEIKSDHEENVQAAKITKRGKWQRFRELREVVIDQHLYQKRLQKMAQLFLKQIFMRKHLQKLEDNIIRNKHQRAISTKAIFVCLMAKMWLRQIVRRKGRTIWIVLQRKLEMSLTYMCQVRMDTSWKRAKNIIRDFILVIIGVDQAYTKVYGVVMHMIWMQKFIRKKISYRLFSKINTLQLMWDKTLMEIDDPNIKKDKQTKVFIEFIKKVPKNVRFEVLKEYVHNCTKLYNIAFYQQRYMKCTDNKQVDADESFDELDIHGLQNQQIEDLEELIQMGMIKLHKNMELKRTQQVPNLANLNYSRLPKKFEEKYGFEHDHYNQKSYLINHFEQIGMVDPYPDDDVSNIFKYRAPSKGSSGIYKVNNWVYDYQRYAQYNYVPCVYLPNRRIMLKMMRSCIGAIKEEDLWFCQGNNPRSSIITMPQDLKGHFDYFQESNFATKVQKVRKKKLLN